MMQLFEIKRGNHTPLIVLDPEKGNILLEGSLVVPNSVEFFTPILNWIEDYPKYYNNALTVDFKLWYYNTAASKMVIKMFAQLKEISKDIDVKTTWYCKLDDEEMMEIANEVEELIGLKFDFKFEK